MWYRDKKKSIFYTITIPADSGKGKQIQQIKLNEIQPFRNSKKGIWGENEKKGEKGGVGITGKNTEKYGENLGKHKKVASQTNPTSYKIRKEG